jgi:BTB/POZ domain
MPHQNTKRLESPHPKSKPPVKVADAPFNDPDADLVLQSSDEVHFYVVKKILTLASPVFADKFSTLSPPHQKSSYDVLQMVPLPETSTILDIALRHIYPVRTPKTDTLHNVSVLAEFAQIYKVEALDNSIAGYLTDNVERDPLGVYAIAVTYGHKDIGTKAARLCHMWGGCQRPCIIRQDMASDVTFQGTFWPPKCRWCHDCLPRMPRSRSYKSGFYIIWWA